MKKSILIALLILSGAGLAFAEGKPQTTCPVMGAKINKTMYVDVKGYRIYICCAGCNRAIKANPDKFIEKMKADGVELEKAPVKEES